MNTNNNEHYNFTVTCELREGYLEFTFRFISLTFTSVRKLRVDLEAQYQSDRHALIGLNQRFGQYLDRMQLLTSENMRYTTQVAELRRLSSYGDIDVKWHERYIHLQSDVTMIGGAKIDNEADFEVFQSQTGMYQQLIDVNEQWRRESRLKLEQGLKQSQSVLSTLRTSYTELEREIAGLRATREDTYKHYLKITHDWCITKKYQKKEDLRIRKLKTQIAFFKNLRSHSAQYGGSLSVESVDVKQFWSLELDKCVVRIRHDFELLYTAIYRQMTTHYQVKIEEMETNVKQAVHYQKEMTGKITVSQQKLRVEYEEVQKILFYEKQTQTELEAKFGK